MAIVISLFIFFTMELSAVILIAVEHRKPKEPRDRKVVYFTLWLALIFGISAALLAVLLGLAFVGVIPAARLPSS